MASMTRIKSSMARSGPSQLVSLTTCNCRQNRCTSSIMYFSRACISRWRRTIASCILFSCLYTLIICLTTPIH
ncbi:hypothetical protein BC940DRAFT_292277 [Gongronella butleri]|nr:hypothetical protein BC940DRAFT_292277 [Gongronella butleri]